MQSRIIQQPLRYSGRLAYTEAARGYWAGGWRDFVDNQQRARLDTGDGDRLGSV
ncbi:MAG: hypothetical protein U0074_01055 [Kouleothrix sp.]